MAALTTQALSTGHTRASTKAGVAALFTSDVVFAKGAHLGAVHGELRPVSLLFFDRRIRCLLDFGKRERMRRAKDAMSKARVRSVVVAPLVGGRPSVSNDLG